VKVGDAYRLPCGHEGKITWIKEDTIAVEGPTRGNFCVQCNPRSSRSHPTIFLISLHQGKDPILSQEKGDGYENALFGAGDA